MSAPTITQATAPGPGSGPPLDDVMLAMDIVDTLRRRERLVRTELAETTREEDLKARLRKIYSAQGIEVPDHVIAQGVAALREGRFTYRSPPDSFKTRLARLYVKRDRWGRWVGGLAAVGVMAGVLGYFALVAPRVALPDKLTQAHAEVLALARSDQDRDILRRYYDQGMAALGNQDTSGARLALQRLHVARQTLSQEYLIRIVNRPGQMTGVWRIPDLNEDARNYYVLVEAVDSTGRILEVPITNEETRQTESVDIWGQRVDEATFRAVGRDKQDNGIIDRDRFGYKQRGELLPRFEMKTTGGAITAW